MGWIEQALLIWIVCGVVTIWIARNAGKTNLASWFVVGFLLGPIGIVIALVSNREQPRTDPAAVTLAQLGELRAKGHITAEEFEAKKAELLARI